MRPLAATPTVTAAAAAPAAASKPRTVAGCPETFAGYPDAIAARPNLPRKTLKDLQTWLAACHVLAEGGSSVIQAALQSPTSADVVVTIVDPAAVSPEAKGALAVYHARPQGGYTLARTIDGMGVITLLLADDINADGKKRPGVDRHDLWRGSLLLDLWLWNRGTAPHTRPGLPAIRRWRTRNTPSRTSCPRAAARRSWCMAASSSRRMPGRSAPGTETYASLNGAPYTLVGQKYDKSACLYHAIQDADALLGSWATGGFDPAIAAYQAALSDPTLTACWTVKDEVPLLRDFARFRLVVSHVAGGNPARRQTSPRRSSSRRSRARPMPSSRATRHRAASSRRVAIRSITRNQSGRVAIPGRLGTGKPDFCAGRPLSAKIDATGVLNGPKQSFRKGVFQ